jgi:hypothetical protein
MSCEAAAGSQQPRPRARLRRVRGAAPGGPGAPRRRARRCVGPAALILVAAVCSCAKSDPEAQPPGSAATTTTAVPVVYPLRGTPVDDAARASRPALVVKVGNDEAARPPAGINDADIVYEEKVEGPFSRFAAVFHGREPGAVGPVRSGRSTDVGIVSDLNRPLFAFSGANNTFLSMLRAAPLVDVGADVRQQAYERRRDRPAPYNLWLNPARVYDAPAPASGPPPAQFPYRADGAPPAAGAAPAGGFSYGFGPSGHQVAFTWDPALKGWARTQNGTPHVDMEGARIAPANVVVQSVEYKDTGERDVAGTPVPEAELTGSGKATIFTDGTAVPVTWSRPSAAQTTEYRAADGNPVALTPGQTWVVYLSADAALAVTRPDGTPAP